MSFWTLSDDTQKVDNSGTFSSGGGDIEPIPNNTQVKAAIDEAKWDSYEDDEYISLRWTVLAPAEFKNRKIFQKVRVKDSDSKKADKAKRMLGAIAANAGGGLLKIAREPSDSDLQKHLLMKPMALTLMVWEIEQQDGTSKRGNWVQQVAPANAPAQPANPAPRNTAPALDESDEDDDIGF